MALAPATLFPPEAYALARRVGLRTATAEAMPADASLGLGLPATLEGRPALLFLASLWDHGEPPSITRPWLSIVVALDGQSARILESWHEEPGETEWLCHSRSEAALLLDPAVERVLEREYEELVGSIAETWSNSSVDELAVARLAELFCFLVPAPLFDWYRLASPSFIQFVEGTTGRALAPHEAPPTPRSDLLPDPDGELGGWLADAPLLPGRDHLLAPGTLAHALDDLGVRPAPHSPLATLDLNPSGFGMGEIVPDWPTPEWRAALRTLAGPACLIEVQVSDGEAWARERTYGAGPRVETSWVLHDFDGEEHLVSFPRRPEEAVDRVQEFIGSEATGSTGDRIELSYTGVAALLTLAQARADGRLEGPSPIGEVAAASEAVLSWDRLATLLVPHDLSPPDVMAGLQALATAGWAKVSGATVEMTPAGSAIIELLDRPRSAVALRIHEYADLPGGCANATGFLAVRTDARVWLCGVARSWDCEDPPDDPAVRLVAVDPGSVVRVAGNLLGLV